MRDICIDIHLYIYTNFHLLFKVSFPLMLLSNSDKRHTAKANILVKLFSSSLPFLVVLTTLKVKKYDESEVLFKTKQNKEMSENKTWASPTQSIS